jgi:hypothetical protein
MNTKKCTKCKDEFPATREFFHKHINGKYGVTSRCKECLKLDYRESYKKQKLKTHNYKSGKKRCTNCKEEFPATLEFFTKKVNGKYGLTSKCKKCNNSYLKQNYQKHRDKRLEQKKEYHKNNREKLKQKNKKWYHENKEYVLEQRKIYAESNKDVIRERQRKYMINKYYSDAHTKIKMNLSRRMRDFFKKNGSRTVDFIGCSIDDLKIHIEKQFVDGMSWENYGVHGWHIDHIRPCCSFDLTDPEQQKECFHYTNLQPLWAKDNIRKGGRYEQP